MVSLNNVSLKLDKIKKYTLESIITIIRKRCPYGTKINLGFKRII